MYVVHASHERGFSFIELLVTAAVVTLVFGGLFGIIQNLLKIITETKISSSALSLATERIEYVRSLPYTSVGTVGGIPDGLLSQNSTTTLNGILFHERVLIEYVDSPADGFGGADTNGILADYKRVKVEYSWSANGATSSIFLLTNIIPPGIETTAGGGTLVVNVYDANIMPLSNIGVRIYNNTTTSTIDTMRFTNSDGVAMFAGAPAAANYELTVSQFAYSSDGTYTATTTLPNPNTPPVAVLESTVSTMTFFVDLLSDLTIRTVGLPTTDVFTDTFTDESQLYATSSVVTSGGVLHLADTLGVYAGSGNAQSEPVRPPILGSWSLVSVASQTPADTTATVRVYGVDVSNVYTLIPDTDLPGNAAGFTTDTINISALDPLVYTGLALDVQLTTANTSVTPSLEEWSIEYVVDEPPIASVPVTVTLDKVIGTDAGFSPVYKYQEDHVSDGDGEIILTDIEWGTYRIDEMSGYDVAEACDNIPYTLAPGSSESLTLTLVPSTGPSLRVAVTDATGAYITNASVVITGTGVNETALTSVCGQVFFTTGLTMGLDYQIDVSAAGYAAEVIPAHNLTNDDAITVVLSPI